MKIILKKIFFIILIINISFFPLFVHNVKAVVRNESLYIRTPEPSFLLVSIDYILLGFSFVVAPIIFFIWLYFYIQKKIDKRRFKRYTVVGIVMFLFTYLLSIFIDYIIKFYIYSVYQTHRGSMQYWMTAIESEPIVINYLLGGLFLISPIIFFLWLYLYKIKRIDKNKFKIYTITAITVFIITVLLKLFSYYLYSSLYLKYI